jgi:hypothetical protein
MGAIRTYNMQRRGENVDMEESMPLSARATDEPCCENQLGAAYYQEVECAAYLRTVAAAVVETVQAPPAITFLHARHFQIPTAVLLTESCTKANGLDEPLENPNNNQVRTLPQKVQVYRACCDTSIFFTCLRREAP